MKVRCSHGYFFFEEESAGELARFTSRYGFEIVSVDNYWTFEELAEAPRFSLKNLAYLGSPAIETFEGNPWDVMRKNKLVFDFTDFTVKPISTVVLPLKLDAAQYYSFSDGLILPGSVAKDGTRVTDFTAQFNADALKVRYTEVIYG